MGIGRVVYKRVLKRIQTTGPTGDVRSLRTLAWLETGIVLEQDIRLPRIALAMEALATMDARARRLGRGLLASVDGQSIYRRLVRRDARCWHKRRTFLLLDTTSIGGRMHFARLALRQSGPGCSSMEIPVKWMPISRCRG